MPGNDAFFARLDRLVDRWTDVLRGIEAAYAASGRAFDMSRHI
jgi:hypothetical protein